MNKQNFSPHKFLAGARLETISLQGKDVRLYVPNRAAVHEAYQRNEIDFPYWSKVWPAAMAMGEFLMLHPHFIANKTVVELGAGLGLPSLVAASYASSVLCTDAVEDAVSMAQSSAQYNRLENFQAAVLDWNHLPAGLKADVILLSDINYEPAAFNVLMKMIRYFLEKEMVILLSTPQRLVAKDFIAPLLQYSILQTEISVAYQSTQVMMTVLVLCSRHAESDSGVDSFSGKP